MKTVHVADDRGSWAAEDNEPFNAALGGVSPELFSYSAGAGNGCAIAFLWVIAIGLISVGAIGPSVILLAIGGALAGALAWRSVQRFRQRPARRRG